MNRAFALLPVALLAIPSAGAAISNGVTSGAFRVEPPTLLNLGFNWDIAGDGNRNATVEVTFRAAGTQAWRPALPLLRLGGERIVRAAAYLDYTVPDRFAGSILNLEPETEYECRFTMKDPDGVAGEAAKTVRVRTRGVPTAAAGGRVLHVYPPNHTGRREVPAFLRFMEAYQGGFVGDWASLSERMVQPGDTLLIHAGLYRPDPLRYVDPHGLPFDGTFVLTAKGTPEKPIVIKAAGDGEVIFDGGAGMHTMFNVMAADHHIFDGLTFRNVHTVFQAGLKNVLGPNGLVVRNCRFENVGTGISAQFAGSRDFYIADNVFLGRKDRHRLTGWTSKKIVDEQGRESWLPPQQGENLLHSYYAIRLYGSGHVVCHNAIAFFHDGIGICTHGSPDTRPEDWAVSVDIYNNDIHLSADDFVEGDGGVHNIRIFRNRGVNAAHGGFSGQPIFGGPAYYYRNLIYNLQQGYPFKFSAMPAGLMVFHNTAIAEFRVADLFSNAHIRNNLFLGADRAAGEAINTIDATPGHPILSLPHATAYSTSDYNGYRPNRLVAKNYVWLWPPEGQQRNFEQSLAKHGRAYATLQELADATGQETHSLAVDYDIFERLHPRDPTTPTRVYHAADLNFALRPGGKAVDAGAILPTINDDFIGRAPDLGALEFGQPAPVYGPRWLKPGDVFYR